MTRELILDVDQNFEVSTDAVYGPLPESMWFAANSGQGSCQRGYGSFANPTEVVSNWVADADTNPCWTTSVAGDPLAPGVYSVRWFSELSTGVIREFEEIVDHSAIIDTYQVTVDPKYGDLPHPFTILASASGCSIA